MLVRLLRWDWYTELHLLEEVELVLSFLGQVFSCKFATYFRLFSQIIYFDALTTAEVRAALVPLRLRVCSLLNFILVLFGSLLGLLCLVRFLYLFAFLALFALILRLPQFRDLWRPLFPEDLLNATLKRELFELQVLNFDLIRLPASILVLTALSQLEAYAKNVDDRPNEHQQIWSSCGFLGRLLLRAYLLTERNH